MRDEHDPCAAAEAVLASDPAHPVAWRLLGAGLLARGDVAAAVEALTRATRLAPWDPDARFDLARAQQALGRLDAAAALYQGLAGCGRPELLADAGAALTALERRPEALALLAAACAAHADFAPLWAALGAARLTAAQPAAAEAALRRAVALNSDDGRSWAHLALALQQQGRFDEAMSIHQAVARAMPGWDEARINYAWALRRLGRLAEARDEFAAAEALRPSAVAATGLGLCQWALADHDAAQASLARACAYDPSHPLALRARALTLLYADAVAPEDLFAAFNAVGAALAPPAATVPAQPKPVGGPKKRLRVGIVSAELYDHPQARNLRPVLEHLDRDAFELWLYPDSLRQDATSDSLRGLADHWRPIVGLTDADAAAQIRADGVDLLYMLCPNMDCNRPSLALHRPAPAQVVLDQGTTGLAAYDLYLTDADLLAAARRGGERFTEANFFLAPTHLHAAPPNDAPDPGPPPSLARGVVTFGCFNNPAKFAPSAVDLWRRVLAAVPGARLTLKYWGVYADPASRAAVLDRLAALGLPLERVDVMGDDAARGQHLAAYQAIDVALDTRPFSGATTSFEALWMGVPVIAWPGDAMVSAVTAMMLRQAGLPELIARDADDFVRLAVDWAAEVSRRTELRRALRARLAASDLCDGRVYAASHAALFRSAWMQALARARRASGDC